MWQDDAACKGMNREIFYEGLNPDKRRQNRPNVIALATCQECPVRQECLNFALENEDEWGIWGGLIPEQRALLSLEEVS